jgi:hypothetical protein
MCGADVKLATCPHRRLLPSRRSAQHARGDDRADIVRRIDPSTARSSPAIRAPSPISGRMRATPRRILRLLRRRWLLREGAFDRSSGRPAGTTSSDSRRRSRRTLPPRGPRTVMMGRPSPRKRPGGAGASASGRVEGRHPRPPSAPPSASSGGALAGARTALPRGIGRGSSGGSPTAVWIARLRVGSRSGRLEPVPGTGARACGAACGPDFAVSGSTGAHGGAREGGARTGATTLLGFDADVAADPRVFGAAAITSTGPSSGSPRVAGGRGAAARPDPRDQGRHLDRRRARRSGRRGRRARDLISNPIAVISGGRGARWGR